MTDMRLPKDRWDILSLVPKYICIRSALSCLDREPGEVPMALYGRNNA